MPLDDGNALTHTYEGFLRGKARADIPSGLSNIPSLPGTLKPFQAAVVRWALRRGRSALFEGTGLGKAQPVTSCVLTPTGWRSLRDVSVGDEVVGSNGRPTKVTGVFPQGKREAYRVAFSDGVSVLCDREHLWSVQNKKQRHMMQGYRVRSVSQIVERGLHHQQGWRHFIPLVSPIAFSEAELPLDPYLLGCLIGDGSLVHGSPSISSADEEILSEVARLLPGGVSLKFVSAYDWRISGDSRNNQWMSNSVTEALRSLGLHGKKSDSKFVPLIYLFASVSQRCAMLQGLLDTDGHVRSDNNVEFTTSSERLAEDVRFIVQSLGGLARIRVKKTTHLPCYRMSVQLPFGIRPFRLSRKADVYHDRQKYQPSRAIVSIEATGEIVEMVCISVEAPDQLYVTEHCVVTHNTIQQLSWARAVADYEQGRVLVLTPLAVAEQSVGEASKFGVASVAYAADGRSICSDIVVTNYERFDKFDISDFCGIVLDESGLIKSEDGYYRQALTEACFGMRWRLCCTATPAPNDYTELGQHAEFLGVMTAAEMLATFFVHDGAIRAGDEGGADGWRLKRHAITDFWRWVASWAVVMRHPRDLGFDDSSYDLPPLRIEHITVHSPASASPGALFSLEALTLSDRIRARRDTLAERVRAAAEIVRREPDEPWLVWCNLNAEADGVERALADIGALQVSGSQVTHIKVERLLGFCRGAPPILVSKPSIAGHGMNWQHCSHMIFVGLTDSFEAVYQAIRRAWRFGQVRPVTVYFVSAEVEGAVVANIRRKERAYDRMFESMLVHMQDFQRESVLGDGRAFSEYIPTVRMGLPAWLSA